jgi:LPS-assembly lipoprotein
MSPAVSSTSWSRRGLLGLGAAALGLGGCGFEPLHARGRGPGLSYAGPVADELAAVRVALIPDRNGQVLRRELQQRLEGPVAARYDLRVGLSFAAEPVAIRRDGTATRVRTIGIANWSLLTTGQPPEVVATGLERTLDAFNIPDDQFFAADVSREAMERRLLQQIADDIVRNLAVQMRRRVEPARAQG